MKQRIKYLETQKQQSQQEQGFTSETSESVQHRPSVHSQSSAVEISPTSKKRTMDAAVVEVEYLSLTAMSGPDKENRQSQKGTPTFSSFVQSVLSHNGSNPVLPSPDTGVENHSWSLISDVHRQLQMNNSSIRKLLDDLHLAMVLCYPCTTLEVTSGAIDSVLQAEKDSTLTQLRNTLPERLLMSYLSVTIGVDLLPCRRALNIWTEKLVKVSKGLVPDIAAKSSDAMTVRCLTMQTITSLYHPSAGPSWHLLGLSLTRAISIGLHRLSSPNLLADEAGSLVLLFWTIYLMDRAMAFSLSRPFGIEDGDITIEVPDIGGQYHSESSTQSYDLLFIWKIHHARLLSSWQRMVELDLNACFYSFDYWLDSYRELRQRRAAEESVSQGQRTGAVLAAIILKDESQLSFQALVQLNDLAIKNPFDHQTVSRIRERLIVEVPKFVEHLKVLMDDYDLPLTFLDGIDVFSAAIVLAYCVYNTSQRHSFRLSMAQMKVITTIMDIIRSVAESFGAMKHLENIIWAFLTALEENSNPSHADLQKTTESQLENSIQKLRHEIDNSVVTVPNHLKRLMDSCLSER